LERGKTVHYEFVELSEKQASHISSVYLTINDKLQGANRDDLVMDLRRFI
jgi:hypothetical protein